MDPRELERPEVVEIDVADVTSLHELHERLSRGLGFPPFYGKNWDAFWDAISGLVSMPRRLVLIGWPNAEARWPDDAAKMIACMRDLNAKYPASACEFDRRPALQRSPLDVGHIDLDPPITAEEIVRFVREGRYRRMRD